MVHHGFYSAYDNTTLLYEILKSIKWARKHMEIYSWLASLISLHFLHVKFGSRDVELMTFGQPRIGNPAFVVCLGEQVPRTIHVTHQNDIVPQLPLYYYYLSEWTYHHFARELVHISLSILDIYFLCVFHIICVFLKKWVYGMSVADHLEYYSVTLHADSRGTCQFVIGTANQVYNNIREVDGSIILLRYICKNHKL
ncbi:alpha/beta-Hydrolases superfamily protein [Zea mays]|uniref:Alpha/beta-Hydrolases superfamily protein n=1 Tax=Zea mays TaxID=4577 RepID=A0A1D6LXU5_MAIZE|nr:alpha/beta-Hydrolases superfamily protein [Zea mays]